MATLLGLDCLRGGQGQGREALDKIRRRLQQDKLMGKDMAPDWTEENPWNVCLRMLALDDEYWNEQVRHPWLQLNKPH